MTMTKGKRIAALILLIALFTALLAPQALADYKTGSYRITPSNGVNLRSGAGTKYDKIGAISCDTVVKVTAISGNWGKTTSGGVTGWFLLDNAVLVEEGGSGGGTSPEVSQGSYLVTASLNLRKGPATSYGKYTVIPDGAVITLSEVSGSWGKTTYGGYTGWVSTDYLKSYTETSVLTSDVYAIGYSTALKEEADAASKTLITLPLNTEVTVTEIKGNWGKTTYKGYTGWFSLSNAGAKLKDTGILTGDQRKDMITVALRELGKTNGSKYTFGRGNVAWCAYFVSWVARQVGVSTSVIKTAGYARAYSHGVTYYPRDKYLPSPGDLVYFDWPEYAGDMNHVGIVEEVLADGTVNTVEGNTSNTVARRTYSKSSSASYRSFYSISYFGVPDYTPSAKPVRDAKATVGKKGTVKFSWSATDASYYDVYIIPSTGSGVGDSILRARTSGTSVTFENVPDGSYKAIVYSRPGSTEPTAESNTVTFKVNAAAETWSLTVKDGSGSGAYQKGETVTVKADKAPAGKIFRTWKTSGAGSFADITSPETTFTMPEEDVTVTALYETAKESPYKVGSTYELTASLSLRKDHTTSSELLLSIPKGTKLVPTLLWGSWGKVTYSGKTGWACLVGYSEEAAPESTLKAGTAYKLTSSLSLRKDHTSSSELLLSIPKGTKLTPTAIWGKWGKVSYSGKTGWACLEGYSEEVIPESPYTVGEKYELTSAVNLRKDHTSSSDLLTTVPKGTVLSPAALWGKWGKVTYSGKTGWVSLEYSKKYVAAPESDYTVGETYETTGAVNLRKDHTSSSDLLTTVPKGALLKPAALWGKWGKVTYSGKTGWVSLEYTKKYVPASDYTVGEKYELTSAVNLRKDHTSSSDLLTTVPKGTVVSPAELWGKWGKVTYSGKTGWISLEFSKKYEKPQDPPASGTVYQATTTLNLREKATASSTLLLKIPEGTRVTVTETSGVWGKTVYDGKTGWVNLDFTKKVTASGTVYQATTTLNLREKATASSTLLLKIPEGTRVTVTETSGVWGKTVYDGKTGWVNLDFTKKVTDSGTVYQATTTLNLREKATASSTLLLKIPEGTRVTVTETSGVWGKTVYDGKTGWVNLDFTKKITGSDSGSSDGSSGTVYVTTADLSLRSDKSTSSERLLVIPEGTRVTVTETSGSWGKVTYSGKTGWVSTDYLKKQSTSSGTSYTVTADLSLRSDKSTSSERLLVIPEGTRVTVTETSGSWGKVTYSGKTGWISLDYAKKN